MYCDVRNLWVYPTQPHYVMWETLNGLMLLVLLHLIPLLLVVVFKSWIDSPIQLNLSPSSVKMLASNLHNWLESSPLASGLTIKGTTVSSNLQPKFCWCGLGCEGPFQQAWQLKGGLTSSLFQKCWGLLCSQLYTATNDNTGVFSVDD